MNVEVLSQCVHRGTNPSLRCTCSGSPVPFNALAHPVKKLDQIWVRVQSRQVQDAVGGSLVVALSFDSETGEPLGDIVASSVVFEPASDGDEPLTLPPVTITGVSVNSAQG